jgi:hypothetical protein
MIDSFKHLLVLIVLSLYLLEAPIVRRSRESATDDFINVYYFME